MVQPLMLKYYFEDATLTQNNIHISDIYEILYIQNCKGYITITAYK